MIIETIQEDMRSLVSLSGRECAMRYVTWRTGVLLRGAGETNSEYFAVVKPGQKQREPGFPYKVSFYGLTTAGELQQGIAIILIRLSKHFSITLQLATCPQPHDP